MRKLRRTALLATIAALGALGSVGVAPALAAPIWNLDVRNAPTHFAPGEVGAYWFDIQNVGDADTSGEIRLTIELPAGLTFNSSQEDKSPEFGMGPGTFDVAGSVWNCAGATTIVCTADKRLPRHVVTRRLFIAVDIDPGASGTLTSRFTVEGGGAARAATATNVAEVDAQPAPFEIHPDSWVPDFFKADGLTTVRPSGAAPELATFPFDLSTRPGPIFGGQVVRPLAVSRIRNLRVDLPPGFVGNPTVVGECTQAEFTVNVCPLSSQVGRIDFTVFGAGGAQGIFGGGTTPVYNLFHPRGVINDLGLSVGGNPVHIRASLDPANRYGITTDVRNINETLPLLHQKLTIWGVPADPSHDSERCPEFVPSAALVDGLGVGSTANECASPLPRRAFLSVPSRCDTDHAIRIHRYDSWEDTGNFGPDLVYQLPGQTTDCDRPIFQPAVEIEPTGKEANTPTGIHVSIQVPQVDNPNAQATPPIKSTVVTMPAGTTLNPAFADGLDGCTLAQIGFGTNDPVRCPDNSRIGEVQLTTPLLPEPIIGSMYLAKQGDNFFGSTFALYMAVEDTEDRGALVKIPGRIDLDPRTGDIVTTFDDLPQFPVDDFTLRFRSGQRAPLVNPPTCGTHTIRIAVTSYAQPNRVIDESNSYQVTEGPGGSACPPDAANRPFNPKQGAGTLSPVAGSYAPFVFNLRREDTEQDISTVMSTLPPGLVAKLAGVTNCPDSAITAISTAEGGGRAELASPSCPASSLIGQLSTGVGSGTNPNYFNGRVYQAGPYKGGPLSLAIVVPAIAGPYDFGNVVVRTAVYVDPKTGQVKAISDPLPSIVHGVLLHVREIHLDMSRNQFMLNPTSCQPMSIDSQLFSDLGALSSPSTRFQVGECASLGFQPKLVLKLRGGTKRGAHPQLTGILLPRAGDANIASLSVAFPRSEFLENAHIRTICTRPDFAADNCPAGSIYGRVTAYTPLLDEPLDGLVRLRSSSNLLPDAVGDLRGPPSRPIRVESVGRVDSINGGIRTTFDYVPDAPVSRVVVAMQGGKKGLLVNSRDICGRVYRAKAVFTAHNGLRYVAHPKMRASCKKARKGKGKKAKRRGHSRAR